MNEEYIKQEPVSDSPEKEEIIQKIYETVVDMKSRVQFNEDDHTYKTTKDGIKLQGVSSVSSIVPKDWLSAWGAKEAVKFLGYSDYDGDYKRAEEVLKIIKGFKPTDKSVPQLFIELLKEAKGASGRKSKTALVDGKKGHIWLEEYVKTKIQGQELPKMPPDALKRPLAQFCEWERDNVLFWILSEVLVAYPEKGYAGTMDAMAMMKNGKLAVIDFKFASHISEDYRLQCAGYQATFEAYGIKIDERIIIRLPKTIEKEEWDDKEKKYKMIPNDIEVKVLDKSYEWDRDIFFHALPLKNWCNQFKNY